MITPARVVVPLDFSDASEAVLREAERLARLLPASLVLIHVVEPAAQMVGGDPGFDMVMMPMQVDLEPQKKQLERLADELRDRDLEVTTEVLAGFAVDEILELATRYDASYLVLGSHGHGALYHLFTGGVVTGILKAAPCPVLVVPIKPAKT